MKGIILAGGSGTRLDPLTGIISKQLLPVYDKPMIYYPLATLMLLGLREILIISTPRDLPFIEKLFGDGSPLGLRLAYAVQEQPDGTARALTIGAGFADGEEICLILGDNIFYLGGRGPELRREAGRALARGALILSCPVSDPGRFGVIEFDERGEAVSLEEKPLKPRSRHAAAGLYFYPPDAPEKALSLRPSARGLYEITDLNNLYLLEGRLAVLPLRRGEAWLDAGTPDSLLDAGIFARALERRQGVKLACVEEIALREGFITRADLRRIIQCRHPGSYTSYLEQVLARETPPG